MCYVTPQELSDEAQYFTHDPEEVVECPHLVVHIGNDDTPVAGLVDTGAERSCLRLDYYEELVKAGNVFPELPVSGVQIMTATGRRSKKVSKRALITMKCQGEILEVNALIVPQLMKKLILGQDWIVANQVTISCHKIIRPVIDRHERVFNLQDGRPIYIVVQGEGTEMDSESDSCENFVTLASVGMMAALEPRGMSTAEGGFGTNAPEGAGLSEVGQTSGARRDLTVSQQQCLNQLLEVYAHVFSNVPGKTHVYTHKLEVTDDSPFCGRTYPIPHAHRAAVQEAIDNMLAVDVIERSESHHINPLVVVGRKEGLQPRICLDARILNSRLKPAYERPEKMHDLLRKFLGKTWLSSLDLTSGYWQVPLDKADRKYTAFGFKGQVFHFKRVPFGVKTASAAFIRALNLALGPEVKDYATVYIDDIIVFSTTYPEHLLHLESILSKLYAAGMTVKREKSRFCQAEVKFLGHLITSEGLTPDLDRIRDIRDFPTPRSKKHLQAFLGLTGFFRQHVPSYARIMENLRGLLGSTTKWKWSSEANTAFLNLKLAFERRVLLSQPDFEKPFIIETDASLSGVAGVLYQEVGSERRIISIVSRGLSQAEKKYSICELELLSILHAVTKFREYVLGQEFTVVTDHKALQFLWSSKLSNGRIARWTLILQAFHMKIVYRPGVENYFADFLSRNPLLSDKSNDDKKPTDIMIGAAKVIIDPEIRKRLKNLKRVQEECFVGKSSYAEIREQTDTHDRDPRQRYTIVDGFLNHKDGKGRLRVWIPPPLVNDIIWAYHEELGHYGAIKCYAAISRNFWWAGMTRYIRKLLATCDKCQRNKYPRQKLEGIWQNVLPQAKGETVMCDFFGPLPKAKGGYQYIFVILDGFTKYVRLYPLRRATTRMSLKKFLTDYCVKFGTPKRILSDNGSQFSSKIWENTLAEHGVQVIKSSIRNPESNQAEKVMYRLGQIFRTFCSHRHVTWIEWLGEVERMTNLAMHSSTGYTPYELQTGNAPQYNIPKLLGIPQEIVVDQAYQIQMTQKRMKHMAERRGKQQKIIHCENFEVGDSVLVRIPGVSSADRKEISKFFAIFQGPFVIKEKLYTNAYLLADTAGRERGKFNVRSLKRYIKPGEVGKIVP